jgi:hypothetical protein
MHSMAQRLSSECSALFRCVGRTSPLDPWTASRCSERLRSDIGSASAAFPVPWSRAQMACAIAPKLRALTGKAESTSQRPIIRAWRWLLFARTGSVRRSSGDQYHPDQGSPLFVKVQAHQGVMRWAKC